MKKLKKIMSAALVLALGLTIALSATGCNEGGSTSSGVTERKEETVELGEGKNNFSITVTEDNGNQIHYKIHTDEKYVGTALQKLEMIYGEMGEYGLYVKTVNGMRADYELDGYYWSFYIDGEYADKAIDTVKIDSKKQYELKMEKA